MNIKVKSTAGKVVFIEGIVGRDHSYTGRCEMIMTNSGNRKEAMNVIKKNGDNSEVRNKMT